MSETELSEFNRNKALEAHYKVLLLSAWLTSAFFCPLVLTDTALTSMYMRICGRKQKNMSP